MAKRFHFELQTVLNVRAIRADAAKRDFGRALAAVQAVEEQLRAWDRLEREGKQELADMSRERIDVVQLRLQKQYLFSIAQHKRIAQTQLLALQQTLALKRHALMEAQRDQRAMELLRDKRQQEYAYAMDRAEQHVLDDMKNFMREEGG